MFVYAAFITAAVFLGTINGSESRTARIKGGQTASINDHPYMVQIRFGQGVCGGAIISKDAILTAAHCAAYLSRGSLLRVGTADFRFFKGQSSVHQVDFKYVHDNYKMTFIPKAGNIPYNDIAVLKIKPPFVFGDKISSIPMFDVGEQIATGSSGTVSGWGLVPANESGQSSTPMSDKLRSVVVPIVNKTTCAELYKTYNVTAVPVAGQICAGDQHRDSCSNDSGGPLIVNGKLAGIVSVGTNCNIENRTLPGIYADVAYYRKWIDEKIMVHDIDPR